MCRDTWRRSSPGGFAGPPSHWAAGPPRSLRRPRSFSERGIPDSQIHGGYAVNGWLQYAHPDSAYRDKDGRIMIPSVNAAGTLEFQVANSILPSSRVVESVPFRRWWNKSGCIYVLERDA